MGQTVKPSFSLPRHLARSNSLFQVQVLLIYSKQLKLLLGWRANSEKLIVLRLYSELFGQFFEE